MAAILSSTIGRFIVVTSPLKAGWRRHFCRALHVAMQIGLYHHPVMRAAHFTGASRTVSGDPLTGFLLIAWITRRIVTTISFAFGSG